MLKSIHLISIMTIRNIKASFILDEKVPSPSNFVVKQNTFVITIYGNSPNLVNVTGMKSFVYFHPKKSEYPTILFFRTGSYTMMGAKKKSILMECEHFVINLIIMFNKKSNKRLMKYLLCLFQYSVQINNKL